MWNSSSSASRLRSRSLAALLDHLEHGADVVLHGQAAEDRGLLRQVADAEPRAAVHRHGGDVEAVDLDRPLVDRHEAGDHVEAGRLAGAVGAEQADRLAGAHAERHAAHHLAALVALGQAARDQRALSAGICARTARRAGACAGFAPPEDPDSERRAVGHYWFCEPGVIDIMTRPDGEPAVLQPSTCALPVFICTVSLQPTRTFGALGEHDLLARKDENLALHVEDAAIAGGDLVVRLDVDLAVDLQPVDVGRAGGRPSRRPWRSRPSSCRTSAASGPG